MLNRVVFILLFVIGATGARLSAQNLAELGTTACSSSDVPSDLDGDGLTDSLERTIGTALNRTDTDYDGFSDCEELIEKGWASDNDNYRFNPLIADVPSIGVVVSGTPVIEILYTESEVESITVGNERSSTTSSGVANTSGGAKSSAVESSIARSSSNTETISATATAGVSASFTSVEASASVSATIEGSATNSVEYSDSSTNETSLSWDRQTSQEKSQALTAMNSRESELGITASEGVIRVAAYVQNTGRISATIEGISLSAETLQPITNSSRPLPTLTTETPPFTLVPGQRYGPIAFEARLSVAETKRLLSDASGLVISAPGLELLDVNGRPFAHSMTNIPTQTARIIIDYGVAVDEARLSTAEDFRVAIPGNASTASAASLLNDVLKIDVTEGTIDWSYSPQDRLRVGPGVLSVRGVEASDASDAYWAVVHTTNAASGFSKLTTTYDVTKKDAYELSNINVRRGDTLHFVRISDPDRDGLGNRVEAVYGTNELSRDTDQDGFSDYDEIVGWVVTSAYGQNTRNVLVTSNPLLRDLTQPHMQSGRLIEPGNGQEAWTETFPTREYDKPIVAYPLCNFVGKGVEISPGITTLSGFSSEAANRTIASLSVSEDYLVKLWVHPTRAEARAISERTKRPTDGYHVSLDTSVACIPDLELDQNLWSRAMCVWAVHRDDPPANFTDPRAASQEMRKNCSGVGRR